METVSGMYEAMSMYLWYGLLQTCQHITYSIRECACEQAHVWCGDLAYSQMYYFLFYFYFILIVFIYFLFCVILGESSGWGGLDVFVVCMYM